MHHLDPYNHNIRAEVRDQYKQLPRKGEREEDDDGGVGGPEEREEDEGGEEQDECEAADVQGWVEGAGEGEHGQES